MRHDTPATRAKVDCPCRRCRARRAARWARLSPAVRNLLSGLAYGPRLWGDLAHNQHVRWRTLRVAEREGLVIQASIRLGPFLSTPISAAWRLTDLGIALFDTASSQRIAA